MTDDLETLLRSLIKGEFSSIHLGFNNDHGPNYTKAADWEYYNDPEDRGEWVSEEEKTKALATNSVWTLQWYPDTPVGFCCIRASSLAAIVKYLREAKP